MPLSQQQVPQEPWYASGTTWTIIGIIVAILLAAWAVWAAFRSARPRRTLHVWAGLTVPLVNTAPGLHGRKLEVTLDGHKLKQPYVVEVAVASRGVLDISAGAFGGKPLELQFDSPIVALLEQSADAGRPAVREPKVEVTNTGLHIGPALLTRQHRLNYTVLLDGKPNFRAVGELENVIIREDPVSTPIPRSVLAMASIGMLAMVAGLFVIPSGDPGSIAELIIGTIFYLAGAVVFMIGMAKWRRGKFSKLLRRSNQ